MRVLSPVIILSVMLGLACGPPDVVDEKGGNCIPKDLKVTVDRESMIVSWNPDCSDVMAGYNIYISQQPLADQYPGNEVPASVASHNPQLFLGDTEPEDGIEHYEAIGLQDGVQYYVSVRSVFADRTLSRPSKEIAVSCGPRGEFDLAARYTSQNDGFSFVLNESVRADSEASDLYFFSKDGIDYLASPNRLNGFLRESKLERLTGNGDLAQVKGSLKGSNPEADRVVVKKGDWVHIVTADGSHALVRILAASGEKEKRTLRLEYAYTPSADPLIL